VVSACHLAQGVCIGNPYNPCEFCKPPTFIESSTDSYGLKCQEHIAAMVF